jgi:hypothetical protein
LLHRSRTGLWRLVQSRDLGHLAAWPDEDPIRLVQAMVARGREVDLVVIPVGQGNQPDVPSRP